MRVIESLCASDCGLGFANARQRRRKLLDRAVEELGLLEMRGMARTVELDGARLWQGFDQMVGRVRTVEMAVGAVDDERGLADAGEQRPRILPVSDSQSAALPAGSCGRILALPARGSLRSSSGWAKTRRRRWREAVILLGYSPAARRAYRADIRASPR